MNIFVLDTIKWSTLFLNAGSVEKKLQKNYNYKLHKIANQMT